MKPELLSGDNQFEVEGHGKQDAERFIRFKTLPPVLQIHLMRFTIEDSNTQKINQPFQIYNELNLDQLLKFDNNAEIGDNLYQLNWVIMHIGEAYSGHYICYVKHNNKSNVWIEYNDK